MDLYLFSELMTKLNKKIVNLTHRDQGICSDKADVSHRYDNARLVQFT